MNEDEFAYLNDGERERALARRRQAAVAEAVQAAMQGQQQIWAPSACAGADTATLHRTKKWPPGTPVWEAVRRRRPLRFLLRLPLRLWRACCWPKGYNKPQRRSWRERRAWENLWGPRDGDWERWRKERC